MPKDHMHRGFAPESEGERSVGYIPDDQGTIVCTTGKVYGGRGKGQSVDALTVSIYQSAFEYVGSHSETRENRQKHCGNEI